ncbi:troponin c [Cryptosporidium sp. chipmunk genotype I]|uniref:troponin c n=1 Tax=Cryptosporidium sp. chipmunk genotype I TaxID=1280935 RepID=UPI00351AAED2|nr:troponin c [Cryptosporidium sp. chipmunk genotype I]
MVLGEVSGLSKSRIDELRQFFKIVDRDKTGKVSEEKIIHMLNAIGVQLTRRDKLAIKAESNERGFYTVEDLIKIGEVVYNDRVIARDLVESLQSISDGKDTISSVELRKHLLNIGSIIKLSPEEVNCILSDIGENNINIYDFVSYCISE